jgi:hypothetical protein
MHPDPKAGKISEYLLGVQVWEQEIWHVNFLMQIFSHNFRKFTEKSVKEQKDQSVEASATRGTTALVY